MSKVSGVIIALLVLVILGGAYKFIIQGSVMDGEDGRTVILLDVPERLYILGEMRNLLAHMQQLTAAISEDDMDKVIKISETLVGDQSDPRARTNKSGKRHTSGALRPEHGGTGDYEKDLETLAGETSPATEDDPAPIGSSLGTNGVFGRPNSSGGHSIDIPANGNKPSETLHYD